MIGALWNQKALTGAPVPLSKLAMVAEKAMAKCDDVDGLTDGLIDDPRNCRFDPARDVPACREGADTADCLTAAQASTIAEDLRRPGQQRQAVLPRLHGGQRSARAGPQRHDGQLLGERDYRGAADREARRTQPRGRRHALPRAGSAAARVRRVDIRLRSRYRAGGALEQARRRDGSGPVEVPQERRQI